MNRVRPRALAGDEMTEASEQRFVDIEMKLSHQEYLIEELNQVVRTQQEALDQLEKLVKAFFKKFRDGNTDSNIGPADEKPPHY